MLLIDSGVRVRCFPERVADFVAQIFQAVDTVLVRDPDADDESDHETEQYEKTDLETSHSSVCICAIIFVRFVLRSLRLFLPETFAIDFGRIGSG